MKKLLLFVTMAASLLFTQCKKEDSVSSAGKTVRMTVTAGPGSKTDITENGAITWSDGDQLYVGDGSKYIGYLTLVGEGGSATGVFTGNVTLPTDTKDGEKSFGFFYLGSAERTLTVGDETAEVDFSSQDITKGTDGKLTNASKQHVGYGSATGTVVNDVVTDINVMLVSKVALAHFSFKKGDAAYTDGLTLKGDNICNKMTVNFDGSFTGKEGSTTNGISLGNGHGERYVMLVPTSTVADQALTFAGDNVAGTATLNDGIKPNQFYGKDTPIAVTLEAASAPSYLPGDFSVSESKTVKFASGNLYYDGTTDNKWKFEANQWDFRTYNGKGSCIDGTYDKDKGTPTDDWGLFGWSGSSTNHYGKITTTNNSDYSGTTLNDWGGITDLPSAGEGKTWSTLTKAEWDYLLNSRSTDASSLRAWVTLDNNVPGLVILPDGSTTDASTVTTTALVGSSGAVFLPAAGRRNGTDVSLVGSFGNYWSSTPVVTVSAYCMLFGSNPASTNYFNRYIGYAVRLVR